MSADDGIYILQTYGPEYRVAHAMAIDNIYDTLSNDGHWTPNKNMLFQYFGKSKVFQDLADAWDYAFSLDEEHGTEYCCLLLTDFSNHKFGEHDENNT